MPAIPGVSLRSSSPGGSEPAAASGRHAAPRPAIRRAEGLLGLIRTRPHLRFRYRGLTFELLDRPGMWMDSAGLQALQRRIIAITHASCGAHPTKGLYVDTGLMKDKIITICTVDGVDCAFNAMVCIGSYEGRPILHTGPAFSARTSQGIVSRMYGLSYCYFVLKCGLRSFYTTTITHVPRGFGMMVQTFSNIYPDADPTSKPAPHHEAIRDILVRTYVREIEPEYVLDSQDGFLLKAFRAQKDGSMVPCFHTPENVPKHRNPRYSSRCLSLIDYDRGDALIMVGEVGFTSKLKLCAYLLMSRRGRHRSVLGGAPSCQL
jgi:hypothetical protein